MASPKTAAKTIGRPRAFDAEKALDAALKVFWQKGYEGASMADLTAAMGINPPSLYAAFGNKESLFRQALDRYGERQRGFSREALEAPTAREAIRRLLQGAVDMATGAGDQPRGCLLVHGALSCGDDADPIRRDLIQRRAQGEAAVRKRLERARAEGDLADSADPAELARYVTTVMQGMAVQAQGGAKKKDLQRVAELAMKAFETTVPR